MARVNIVIPVYKQTPDSLEVISLSSFIRYLSNYEITLLVPEHFDTSWYRDFFLHSNCEVGVQRFPDAYFINIDGYNKLLTSVAFYERFTDFEYILICQPDCYIFRDDLEFWCSQEYDYVAAPWLQSEWRDQVQETVVKAILAVQGPIDKLITRISWKVRGVFRSELFLVGNGGLSLRRVSAFKHFCSHFDAVLKTWAYNEDLFFGIYVPLRTPRFKIVNWKTAISFAVDLNPQMLMTYLDGKFPFGCHGWNRNDYPYSGNLDFWSPIIERLDPTLTDAKRRMEP